jgi:uncharacterized membrane protein
MILCYAIPMSLVTLLKHYLLFSYAWDLGIFSQAFWSTIHGRFFYYTVEPWFGDCFFAVHFSPILLFVVPFYAAYPHPGTLLVLQSFVVALGVVPLYFLAKDKLSDRLAFLVAASYLINPLVIGANLYDFHFEAFIPVTLFSTIYFLKRRNLKLYVFSLFLSLMVHEYVAFFAVLIVAYETIAGIKSREALKKIAPYVIITITLAIIWLVSASAVQTYLRRQETQSMNIFSPVLNAAGNPVKLLSYLGYDFPQKLLYLILLLAPLLFTPLLSSYIFLTVPWLLFAFLLNYSPYYQIGYQYSLLIIPFVYLSSIHGLRKINLTSLKKVNVETLLMISTLVFLLASLTLVQIQLLNFGKADSAQNVFSLIPEDASILVTSNLFPHVSNRLEAWVLPFGYDEPYPMYYTGISEVWKNYAHKILNEKNPEFVLLDLNTEGSRNLKMIASELLAKRSYGMYAYADGILLLKRNFTGDPSLFKPFKSSFNYETLSLYDGSKVPDTSAENDRVLVHTPLDFDNATFWGGPHCVVPQGEYSASFKLKLVGDAENRKIITLAVTTDGAAAAIRTLNSTTLNASNLEEGVWEQVVLKFEMETFGSVEFTGLRVSNAVNLYLDYIDVVQLDYKVG